MKQRPVLIDDGPWNRMVDAKSPKTRTPGAAYLIQNCYPRDSDNGDSLVQRPGFVPVGSQLGTAGRRRVQGTYQFTKKDGTEFTIAIVGGYFYTLNWSTGVWTEVITNAQLGAAAITLSQTAKVAFLTFNNTVLVTDGVNVPFTWDGTTGAGLVSLTNCPVLYGQPTTYQARIVGIKASNRAVITWSEVNAANTGYEMVGYTNAWTVAQTDSNQLMRVVGTNDALYIARARSATAVLGRPETFVSSPTREGVSESVGTSSPWAMIQSETGLFWLDSDFHPQYLRAGGNLIQAWEDLRETTHRLPRTSIEKCYGVYWQPGNLFLFAVPVAGGTEATQMLVYSGGSTVPLACGIWTGEIMTSIATLDMVKNGSKQPTLLMGNTDGDVFRLQDPEDAATLWDDYIRGSFPRSVPSTVTSQALADDPSRELLFDRLDVIMRVDNDSVLTPLPLTVELETPSRTNATAASPAIAVDVTHTTGDQRMSLGLDHRGRWLKVTVKKRSNEILHPRFGISSMKVYAYPAGDSPYEE